MSFSSPDHSTDTATKQGVQLEDMYEVILHNDDINEAGYVVLSLMRIFKHGKDLALKIMLEAHGKGQSVAEVESETPAKLHRDQLQSRGLSVTISKI